MHERMNKRHDEQTLFEKMQLFLYVVNVNMESSLNIAYLEFFHHLMN